MAAPGKGKTTVQVVMAEDDYEALQSLAQELKTQTGENIYVSDIIRAALRSYVVQYGMDNKFFVDRGGWRGGSKDDSEE